jgi:hypothetical protein
MSGAWSGGSTRAWRRVRASVLARDRAQINPATGEHWRCRAHDEGWCARSGVGPHACEGIMVHAHHTLGRLVTGDDPRHIVGACEVCNLKIGEPRVGPIDPPAAPVTAW